MYEGETIKYLNDYEKEALFRAIQNDNSIHKVRNKAIFYLAEYGALRASEVGMIKVSDFNKQARTIYFRRLKGSKNNTLRILEPCVYDSLMEYLEYRHSTGVESDFLFLSQKGTPISRKTLDDIMKKYCQLAGIPKEKAHFHALKHTRAVRLADMGFDTKEIQYWTGHKKIQNTEIYFQFTSRQQDALYQKFNLLLAQYGGNK